MSRLMIEPHSARHMGLPKPILASAAVLVLFALTTVSTARLTGAGRQETARTTPLETLQLSFEDRDDGSILVRNATSGAAIFTVAPETNGFIRATLRGLAHDRRRAGLDASIPFRLSSQPDGLIRLEDPATERQIDLNAFGPTNVGAFIGILEAGRRTQ